MKQLFLYSTLLALLIIGGSAVFPKATFESQTRRSVPEKSLATDEYQIDTLQADLRLHPTTTYAYSRAAVAKAQQAFRVQYTQARTAAQKQQLLDSAGYFLTETIVNQLIPHWYGTPWSFDGYTEVPRKGHIACGYLVSTVLMHAGLNLNRYKMAQQDPWCEVQTLHQQALPITFPTNERQEFADSIQTYLKDGLYILGMKNHVGMLLKRRGDCYLIHSSYLLINDGKAEVTIERVADTYVIFGGNECMIGEITTNSRLMRQWLLGEPVAIVIK